KFGHYRASCTTYEPEGIFPYASVNAAGHVTFSKFDPMLGVVTALVDPNGHLTLWSHDGFGRVGQVIRPDGTKTTYTLSAASKHVMLRAQTGGGADDTVEYDSLGRPIRWWTYGPQVLEFQGGGFPPKFPARITTEIEFDDLGEHVARRMVPASEYTPP